MLGYANQAVLGLALCGLSRALHAIFIDLWKIDTGSLRARRFTRRILPFLRFMRQS
jgi:hypothetical protein